MKFEYLLFNLVVIAGPLILGAMRRFRFLHLWRESLPAIVAAAVPFLIWDSLVTEAHWRFNENYTIGVTIARLPIEEWLFFLTVPFACLFTWEMVLRRSSAATFAAASILRRVLYLLPLPGVWLFASGAEYTGLVFIFLGIALMVDRLLGTDLFLQRRFYVYLLLITLFTLIFNGYLTWRPVVLYGEAYQQGIRIGTIPIEDFGYGFALLFLATSLFEKLKRRRSTQAQSVEHRALHPIT